MSKFVLIAVLVAVIGVLGYAAFDMGLLGRVDRVGGSSQAEFVEPLPDSMAGKKFLLEWEVKGEDAEALLRQLHELEPTWLMSGEEAEAERIVRGAFTSDLPDSVSGAIDKTFSPRMRLSGNIEWRGAKAFEFTGSIYFTYGNDEAELVFDFAMESGTFGLLPADAARRGALLHFARVFSESVTNALKESR